MEASGTKRTCKPNKRARKQARAAVATLEKQHRAAAEAAAASASKATSASRGSRTSGAAWANQVCEGARAEVEHIFVENPMGGSSKLRQRVGEQQQVVTPWRFGDVYQTYTTAG